MVCQLEEEELSMINVHASETFAGSAPGSRVHKAVGFWVNQPWSWPKFFEDYDVGTDAGADLLDFGGFTGEITAFQCGHLSKCSEADAVLPPPAGLLVG